MTRNLATRMSSSVLALATAGMLLAACSSGTPSSPETTGTTGTGGAGGAGGDCTATGLGYPVVPLKGAKVGFSQSEPETAAFRIAETKSMVDEAKARGATLIHTDANSDLAQQVTDITGMLDQGVQLLIVAPLNSEGLQPALDAARAKKVPVVTVDRPVTATACSDYLTFIGSDFVSQGQRAADALITATAGTARVAILLGSSGNGVTTDRTSGFVEELKNAPRMRLVVKQTANFDRAQGRTVMAALLKKHPDITAVYAENDEMGIGAAAAITAAGKKPGTQIRIVSIDGTRDAVTLLAEGHYNGVIESNPRFGPLAFKALSDFETGIRVSAKIVIQDDEYTPANVRTMLPNAF